MLIDPISGGLSPYSNYDLHGAMPTDPISGGLPPYNNYDLLRATSINPLYGVLPYYNFPVRQASIPSQSHSTAISSDEISPSSVEKKGVFQKIGKYFKDLGRALMGKSTAKEHVTQKNVHHDHKQIRLSQEADPTVGRWPQEDHSFQELPTSELIKESPDIKKNNRISSDPQDLYNPFAKGNNDRLNDGSTDDFDINSLYDDNLKLAQDLLQKANPKDNDTQKLNS